MDQALCLALSHISHFILATMYHSSFTTEGTALKRTSDLPKVTQLAPTEAGMWTQDVWLFPRRYHVVRRLDGWDNSRESGQPGRVGGEPLRGPCFPQG